MQIRVSVTAPVAVDAAWRALADIASHVEWMLDAERIVFRTEQRVGVGTAFDCHTKVGPLKTVDRMVVTQWEEGRRIGVRHEGIVIGEGVFELRPTDAGSEIIWTERLAFPTRFGGALTTWIARPVLRSIWKGNLRRLVARLAGSHL